ncbi:DNA polymerase III subunit gamma/tau [Treponema brennaborense]|uniref:DNA polymerase III subunit gamma/tau n=1 Tax=Treponema brennaborense (strain DSM 12168 / CIP 105900 / DD5/3) TaxID=906968 RepID=F4LMT3_TREBD|nr:DNA polymerase III subunit gamma/tau [Treponema brennaborense]AEE17823.1 DNA polymerase III, subunits gamma and tau [Treponema brennaborense DSM 12168]
MAYEVTATRRRPQRFDDLVGQEFVAATLKNAIQSGKIAHAYLFAGPRGCGKTSSARILAKALNCEKGPAAVPCGECAACREITRGSSLDVIEIDGASNTSVNDVRQIKDEVLFPPNSCRYKIYIIDEVHMLSTSAFNALLKTIEEPPPYVIFIFATTELHKVPATIKSRCQQFHFRLVAVEQIKELLAQAAAEIQVQADDEALYWIARESTGSIRDAYTLFDQVSSFSDGHITFDKIREKLGLVGVDRLNGLCEICVAADASAAIERLDEILQSGVSIEQFISNVADYVRSLLLIKTGITKEALLGQSAERYSQAVLAAWNQVQLERALSLFLNLYRDIRYSLNPRYETELAVTRLCGLTSFVSSAEVKAAIETARIALTGSSGGSAGTQPANTAAGSANFGGQPANAAAGSANFGGLPASSAAGSANFGGQPANFGGLPASSAAPNVSALNAPIPNTAAAAAPNPNVPRFSVFGQGGGEQRPLADGGAVPPEPRRETQPLRSDVAESMKDRHDAALQQPEPEFPAQMQNQTQVGSPSAGQTVPGNSPLPGNVPAEAAEPAEPAIPLGELRELVIRELSVSNALTASALMDTQPWVLDGSVIRAGVAGSFMFNQLRKDAALIAELISAFYKRTVLFEPEAYVPEVKEEENVIPEQVEAVCRMFKGSIVGVKK